MKTNTLLAAPGLALGALALVVQLMSSRRRLPVGELDLCAKNVNSSGGLEEFDRILLADQFRVYGLTVLRTFPKRQWPGIPLFCHHPIMQPARP
jgi:hypothetical protein